MNNTENNQIPDFVQDFIQRMNKPNLPLPLLANVALAELKLKKIKVAAELNRTPGAISQALKGQNNNLLYRVIRLINRYRKNTSDIPVIN